MDISGQCYSSLSSDQICSDDFDRWGAEYDDCMGGTKSRIRSLVSADTCDFVCLFFKLCDVEKVGLQVFLKANLLFYYIEWAAFCFYKYSAYILS